MTLGIALIQPKTAVVAVDTTSWTQDGTPVQRNKLHIIAAARTIFFVRGWTALAARLSNLADGLPTYDAIVDAAPPLFEEVAADLPPDNHSLECLIVGWSGRAMEMRGTFCQRGCERVEVIPTSAVLCPWHKDMGPQPRESLCENVEIIAAAQKQVQFIRRKYAGIPIGGNLVAARIDPSRITIETIASGI